MPDNITEVSQELALVVNQAGLAEEKSKQLIANFGKFFGEAQEIAKIAKLIEVTDISQTDEMAKAREIRLQLQKIRTQGVEALRIQLKEQSLREGKAIDGLANVIKALIIPIEEHLAKQEKFKERIETERKNKIESERIAELGKYVENVGVYTLHPDKLSQESFDQLLKTSKFAFEAQKKAEEEAEAIRLAKIEADKKAQEEIKKENERLKKEAEKREAEIAKERKAEQAKIDAERKIQEEKLRIEKKAREEAEEKIRFAKEVELAGIKAKEEAEKKALQAPDKEKLLATATDLDNFKFPILNSEQAQCIKHDAIMALSKVVELIRAEANKL